MHLQKWNIQIALSTKSLNTLDEISFRYFMLNTILRSLPSVQGRSAAMWQLLRSFLPRNTQVLNFVTKLYAKPTKQAYKTQFCEANNSALFKQPRNSNGGRGPSDLPQPGRQTQTTYPARPYPSADGAGGTAPIYETPTPRNTDVS